MKLRWTSKAHNDLVEIRNYSQREWGSRQAAVYIKTIRAAAVAATRAPLQAPSADRYRPGYRKIAAGSHIVFFRLIDDEVEISRVLHGSMETQFRLD